MKYNPLTLQQFFGLQETPEEEASRLAQWELIAPLVERMKAEIPNIIMQLEQNISAKGIEYDHRLDLLFFYTGEKVENQGIDYYVLDADKLIGTFGSDENATWGKKTEPTLIRKAIHGEEIITYTNDGNGKKIEESRVTAKEGQYVFKNPNTDDIYIPQRGEIINEYEAKNAGDYIGNEFKEFIRISSPFKLLNEIIQIPTLIRVKSWGNQEQFLDNGATLKLAEKKGVLEVTGINKSGFDGIWSFTDKEGNVINSNTK